MHNIYCFYYYDGQTQQFVKSDYRMSLCKFFGLHVSVILMTIIRSVRAKEIDMQQRFSLNIMGSHYVQRKSLLHGNFFSSYGPDDGHKNDRNM